MSNISASLEILTKQLDKEKASQNKNKPSPFSRKVSKGKISKNLQDRSLEALKELLAKQKQLADSQQFLSAAHPALTGAFQNELAQITAGDQIAIDQLAPSSEVINLFDKMVDSLLFIDSKGIQETSFYLDGDPFTSSIFSGAKITLTEYSTAPKVFNIQFSADQAALSLFEAHASALAAAFNEGKYGFSIHRIDTEILQKDKPLLPKVESGLEKEDLEK